MTPRTPQDLRSRLDFWQAISGAILALFVLVHLIFDGTVIISAKITDFIGWAMEETYVAQIAAPVILLIILFHFWIAARKMPFRAGELRTYVEHSKALKDLDTWLWLVQVATAIVILFGAFFHVYGVMTDMPITVENSHIRLLHGWVLFYVFFLPCTVLHTWIGIYRIGVKYGFVSKARRPLWRSIIWGGIIFYLLMGTVALTCVWYYTD